jgi:hypothetical protein
MDCENCENPNFIRCITCALGFDEETKKAELEEINQENAIRQN